MLKNKHLSQSAQDISWGSFKDTLMYMSNKYGTIIGLVDAKDTSQICSRCNNIVKKDLSVRVHKCNNCGLETDRDLNASINILYRIPKEYTFNKIINIGQELSKSTLMEISPLFTGSNGKQVKSLK
jgi:putative transposase